MQLVHWMFDKGMLIFLWFKNYIYKIDRTPLIENGDLQFENIKLIIKRGLTRDEFMQSDLFR